MKTLTAKHNGEIIYVHYVSKFLEYVLVSREDTAIRQYKLNVAELTDITEDELFRKLREQEEIEQRKR